MKKKMGVKISGAGLAAAVQNLETMAAVEVLVGFPEDGPERSADKPGAGMTNATLGYIHDNGAPEQNIPARPFMRPGIEAVRDKIISRLKSIAKKGAAGDRAGVEAGYHALGITVKLSIQNTINDGVPPPLSDRTLQARARRGRKGAKAELEARAAGEAPGTSLAKPLVDTAQMRNAVSYAIRARNKRSK